MELRMLNKFVIILLSLKVILVDLLEIRVMGEIRVGVEVGVGVGILRVLVIDIENIWLFSLIFIRLFI